MLLPSLASLRFPRSFAGKPAAVVQIVAFLLLVTMPTAARAVCVGTTVNFEDDPTFGSITCPGDPNCNPAHHAWLLSKGFDILGSPPGYVYTTQISGFASTGKIIGFAEPNFLEIDEGLSLGETLTFDFMAGGPALGPRRVFAVQLTVVPVIGNEGVPCTVTLDAFDGGSNLVATATLTFTGVTGGVLTPGTVEVTSALTDIVTATLTTSAHPPGGLFIESVCHEPAGGGSPFADYGDAPDGIDVCESSPVPTPPPSTYPTLLGSANAAPGRTGPYHVDIGQAMFGASVTAEAAAEQAPCDWISGGCDEDDGPFLLCLDPVPGGCGSGVVVTPGPPCVERAFGVFGPFPGNPCYGMWLFDVTTGPTAGPAGSSFVNVAVDWNLSRGFGDVGLEWPLSDAPLMLGPSSAGMMITPPFPVITCFITTAPSWVVLPFWTRFTLGQESIKAAFPGGDWDGSGPGGGNPMGETEDWVPYGDPPIQGHPTCELRTGATLLTTPAGGSTSTDFGATPLPPGFFGPGSDPFTGLVSFQGQPLTTSPPGKLEETDTVIRLMASVVLDQPGETETVPIELIALSLVSINPIVVTYNGGTNPQLWSVNVTLPSVGPPAQGTMTVKASACGPHMGGTFTSTLQVQPRFTFTKLSGPLDTRVFDAGPIPFEAEGVRFLPFAPPDVDILRISPHEPLLFDHDGSPSTPMRVLGNQSNFYPGVREDRCLAGGCGQRETFGLRAARYDAPHSVTYKLIALRENSHALGPGITDTDGDGHDDPADNCPLIPNPLQEDQDDDGVGNVCDNCNVPAGYNACQEDGDNDGIGDRCEAAGVAVGSTLPARVALGPPQPNPVRGALRYVLQLPRAGRVSVRVFDTNGRSVATALDAWLPAGGHSLEWDGLLGSDLKSGVYYLSLDAHGVREARKFCVVR